MPAVKEYSLLFCRVHPNCKGDWSRHSTLSPLVSTSRWSGRISSLPCENTAGEVLLKVMHTDTKATRPQGALSSLSDRVIVQGCTSLRGRVTYGIHHNRSTAGRGKDHAPKGCEGGKKNTKKLQKAAFYNVIFLAKFWTVLEVSEMGSHTRMK